MIPLLAALACEVESAGDDGFGEVTSGGTTVPTTTVAESLSEGSETGTASQSSTAPTSNDGTDTAASECPVGRSCMSPVPEEWFGPVTVHMGDPDETAPECPESYPNAGLTLMSGYTDPGPAQCECTCNLDIASSCISYVYDYDASCQTFENFLQIQQDCSPFDVDGGAWFYMYPQGTPTCHGEVNEIIPPPVWDAKVMSCRDPEPGAECSTGVCTLDAPEGFETGLCIYREGAHECPDGDYTVHYQHHSGVADDRNCTYCGCGAGTGTCAGNLEVYTSEDCTGASQQAPLNACTTGIAGGHSVAINFTGEGSCPVASPSEATGTIATMGEFTFCCTQ